MQMNESSNVIVFKPRKPRQAWTERLPEWSHVIVDEEFDCVEVNELDLLRNIVKEF